MSRSSVFFNPIRKNKNGEEQVTIKDKKIENIVTEWLESLYWKTSSFENILEQIGIQLPVELSDYNDDDFNFVCTSADGKKYTLQIRFGNMDDFPEISVDDGDEVRNYELIFNYSNDRIPKLTMSGRKETLEGRTISGFYTYWYTWELDLSDSSLISIQIKVPRNYRIDTDKCKKAERFLLTLDTSVSVEPKYIYECLVELLSLSKETIDKCEMISIKYKVKKNKDWKTKARIVVVEGFITEYELFKMGDSHLVKSNGDWRYSGKAGVTIISENDEITMSITGNVDMIASSNPYSILCKAKNVIDLLFADVWNSI